MSNVIIPSISWPRRTDALTGEEDLLRQNPVGDSSGSPKEERIPVSLILSYVLSNLPASETEFTVTESTSDPAASGVTPASSFWNNTNSGEWFIIDANGDSYSLGSGGGSVDTLYSANGNINEDRTVTIGSNDTLQFNLDGGSSQFEILVPFVGSDGLSLTVFENSSSLVLDSSGARAIFDSNGWAYALGNLPASLNERSLIYKGYVDGITLVDNGGGSYTFTNASGATTSFTTGGGSVDTIYNANGSIANNRTVTINDSTTLEFELSNNAIFKVADSDESVSINVREDDTIILESISERVSLEGSGGLIYGGDYSAQFTTRSLVDKGYVDGIDLVDNGGGSFTFTDAEGNTTNFTTGGGSGSGTTISQYSVSNGSTSGEVWASGAGVTITENAGAGELTISIPSGVDLVAVNLFMPAASTDAGAYHIILDYAGLRSFNTSKTNLKIPLIRTGLDNYATASRANPANISENGGNSANTVTYGVSSFADGDGSDLTMSLINFSLGINQMCRLDFPQI